MSWSVLQAVAGGNANPISITMTSNLTSGSKLLVFINLDTSVSGQTWTVTDGNGNSFGEVFLDTSTVVFAGHTNYLACYALDTPVGDVGTKPSIKITPSGGGSGYYAFVLEVTGLVTGQTSAILDGTEGVTSWASQTTASDPPYSSTAANEFLVQFLGDNKDSLGPGSYTAPTGYTSSIKLENTGYGSGGIAWKNSTGGSEAGADWTWTGGAIGAMLLKVAFLLGGVVSSTVRAQTALMPTAAKRHIDIAMSTSSIQAQTAVTPTSAKRHVVSASSSSVSASTRAQTPITPIISNVPTIAQVAGITGGTPLIIGVPSRAVSFSGAAVRARTPVISSRPLNVVALSTTQSAAIRAQTALIPSVRSSGNVAQSVSSSSIRAMTPIIVSVGSTSVLRGQGATNSADMLVVLYMLQ